MLHDLVSQAWTSCLQISRLHRAMPTAIPVIVGGYMMIHVWYHVSSFVHPLHKPWSQRKHRVFIKAAFAIISNYITLVQVNPRYISLFIIPIIMLVFMGALFIKVPSTKSSSMKGDQDKSVEVYSTAECSGISCHLLKEDGNGGVGCADIALFLSAALPSWILCSIEADSGLVVTQFLLFLSSSMGELSMMLANLPSQVAPAFEVIHRASLMVMLLTAHTMAAEALGDDAVLVCLPELVAALVWVTIYLGHDGSTCTLRTVESVLLKVDIPARAVVAIVLTYLGLTIAELKDESDGATKVAIIAKVCSFSVILPILCLFALRQCWGKTKAGPSSELEVAIRLLSFCRDIMFTAGVICLVVYTLFGASVSLTSRLILLAFMICMIGFTSILVALNMHLSQQDTTIAEFFLTRVSKRVKTSKKFM